MICLARSHVFRGQKLLKSTHDDNDHWYSNWHFFGDEEEGYDDGEN